MIYKKKAFSLVEITIGVLIFSIMLIVVMNVFSSGMKGSRIALTHQDNMEVANLLMAQIEYDLLKTTKIEYPKRNETKSEAQFKFEGEDGKTITFSYDMTDNGIDGVHRNVFENNSSLDYYFAKGHTINIKFTHFAVDAGGGSNNDLLSDKHGIWIDLEVGDPKESVASFTMNKLIVVRCPF